MTKHLCACAIVAFAGSAFGQNSIVVPNAFETQAGTGAFLGPLSNAPRTNQLIIHASQLQDIVGQDITGLSWRRTQSVTAAWPAETVTYFSYDILLSDGVDPAFRQFDFGANVVGPQTQVRSGELVISPFAFPGGTVPAEFGVDILFDTPWTYAGGNLVIEIIHTGFSGTSTSVDAITASTGGPLGYLTDFAAIWQGTGGVVQGNFSIVKLITEGGAPNCPPDLNGDGVVDADDFFLFLQLFAAGDPRADFNNDGVIDADDFFAFLNAFAQGC
ncbi:MAG: hypothetical protein EA423_06995 [Phycisphaerales bacterium]|nr:MAG: hypothetical protein EA423_06995 [Phycisphaerales bacterium]